MKEDPKQLPPSQEGIDPLPDQEASVELDVPADFIDALKASQGGDIPIPESFDLKIKADVETHFRIKNPDTPEKFTFPIQSRPQRKNYYRLALIASAAVLVLGAAYLSLPLFMPQTTLPDPTPTVLLPPEHNVIMAYQLQKMLDQQETPLVPEHWDINQDGSLTQADVNELMVNITTLSEDNASATRKHETPLRFAGPPTTMPETKEQAPAFYPYEVIIDSGEEALAAWQIDLTFAGGKGQIVGIEGGPADSVYTEPATYDPKAMMGDRVIMADFSTEDQTKLPKGSTRVATIMVAIPEAMKDQVKATLIVAGNDNGTPIQAQLIVKRKQ